VRDQFVQLIKNCHPAMKVSYVEFITGLIEGGRAAHFLSYESDMLPGESKDLDPKIAPVSNE
jgi:hypothetical protein